MPESRELVAHFVIEGEPATKSRPRITTKGGKIRTYSPDHVKRAESGMGAAYLQQVGRLAPSDRITFAVEATFYVSSGQRRDVDNMLKLVLDGLNKLAWADDHQVYEVSGQKIQSDAPRTEVTIYATGILASRQAQCQRCGVTFPRPPSHAAKKYCSQACRMAENREQRAKTCAGCGKTFTHASPKSVQKYCSSDCAYRAKHVEVTCANCSTPFTKARSLNRSGNAYCSPECKATYWRTHRKSAAKGTCDDCGGPTSKKTYKRCRDCQYRAGGRWAYLDKEAP